MKYVLSTVLCHMLSTLAGHCQLYSLKDCFSATLKNSIKLQKARNHLKSSYINSKSATYNLFPSLDFSSEHIFAGGKNIDPVTNTFVKDQFSGGELELSFLLNIFSGFTAVRAVRAGILRNQAEGYAYEKAVIDMYAAITMAYAKVAYSTEQIATIEKNNRHTKIQADVVSEKINVGKLSKSEYYTINSRYKSEQADLAEERNSLMAALNDLKSEMGMDPNVPFGIKGIDKSDITLILKSDFTPEEVVSMALESHPAILEMRANEKFADMNLKIARGNLLPTLSLAGNLFSNYNLTENNLSSGKVAFNRQLHNNYGKSIGLLLQVPLFGRFKTRSVIDKAKLAVESARLSTKEAEDGTERTIRQLIHDFAAARQKYLLQSEALEQGELSYEAYEERHRLGMISLIELITAKDQLRTVQIKHTHAKLDLYFKYKLIELLLGMPGAEG